MLGKTFYTLHVLMAVIWVGGMAFALFALRPALIALEPPERLKVHLGTLTRFFRIVWHGGFVGAGWTIHAMHLMALIMGAVFVTIVTGPWQEFRRAMRKEDRKAAGVAIDRVRLLVTGNLVLGLLTVAVAAWGSFPG